MACGLERYELPEVWRGMGGYAGLYSPWRRLTGKLDSIQPNNSGNIYCRSNVTDMPLVVNYVTSSRFHLSQRTSQVKRERKTTE